MDRDLAIVRLRSLVGRDLHELAREYDITVVAPNGRVNKGWAGHVLERFLGIPLNTGQNPNFGSWELKSIPLKVLPSGRLAFKETMAITMIDPYQVARTPFEDSHLLSKIRKAVCVARVVGKSYAEPTYIHSVNTLDLLGHRLYGAVREDYEAVRACLNDPARGFKCLTGAMGVYIQPRTKGAAGSSTRAFYARLTFLAHFVSLERGGLTP